MEYMLNGLWTAEFSSQITTGSGVVTLRDGEVLGGDAAYYYIGRYSVAPGSFTATIRVQHFHGELTSIFGPLRTFDIDIAGSASQRLIVANGVVRQYPTQGVAIKMQLVHKF